MSHPTATAIGVFDGVHLGHQALLRAARTAAAELGVHAAALTFDPHPLEVVAPGRSPRMLYSLAERCELLRGYGIERIEVLPFTVELSRLTPEQFVRDFLHERMNARAVIVGTNFRFAYKQAGDPRVLAELGKDLGFETREVAGVSWRGTPVSSSEIRKRIEDGEVSRAARMLGRPYSLRGPVVSGHGIGSKQTVPTLNLAPGAQLLPANGVYITRTSGDDRTWDSITNIGVRPTFGGDDAVSIETYLLSPFDGETPRAIEVHFLRRVREERKFASPEELKGQIFRDVRRAQVFHARLKHRCLPM